MLSLSKWHWGQHCRFFDIKYDKTAYSKGFRAIETMSNEGPFLHIMELRGQRCKGDFSQIENPGFKQLFLALSS